MQISKQALEQIIKEEIAQAVEEGVFDRAKAKWAGRKKQVGGVFKRAGDIYRAATSKGTFDATEDFYQTGTAARIMDLHKTKLKANIEKSRRQHRVLAKDFKKDLRSLIKDKALDKDDPGIQKALKGLKDFHDYLAVVGLELEKHFAELAGSQPAAPGPEATPEPAAPAEKKAAPAAEDEEQDRNLQHAQAAQVDDIRKKASAKKKDRAARLARTKAKTK